MIELLKMQLEPGMLVFSIPMGIVFLYWLFMIVGVLDLDLIDSALGGVDSIGGVDGVADGAVEGAVDGAADSIADGVAEGATAAGESTTALASLLGFMNFGKAPATIVLTIFVFCMWFLANLGYVYFGEKGARMFTAFGLFAIVFVISITVGVLFTHFAGKPFQKLMEVGTYHGDQHLIGKVCVIRSSKVTKDFGQGELTLEGSPLLLNIICEKENDLNKGSKAVIIDYDEERGRYVVEPMF